MGGRSVQREFRFGRTHPKPLRTFYLMQKIRPQGNSTQPTAAPAQWLRRRGCRTSPRWDFSRITRVTFVTRTAPASHYRLMNSWVMLVLGSGRGPHSVLGKTQSGAAVSTWLETSRCLRPGRRRWGQQAQLAVLGQSAASQAAMPSTPTPVG